MNSGVHAKADIFVLLVEDDADDETLTRRAYGKAGIDAELVTARDAEEALDVVFTSGRTPRLVLLDIHLPLLDGASVLEALRAHAATANVPVIVLTTCDDDVLRFRARHLPGLAFVRKPVRPDELRGALAQVERLQTRAS